MKVKELIECLELCNPESDVDIIGYDGTRYEVSEVVERKFIGDTVYSVVELLL